ncbi:putative Late nodulin [Medicago truncatula]|uniref:Putative Late nodulin n=1 Tax=Medicago truncatula TaxID=3880 RepID=A0A396HXQ9_MEDTR|nr:putative Late nodulin [Medicago truncatula]
MVAILKFIYSILLFIFLHLVSTNGYRNIKYCFIDTDCPRSMCHYPEIVRCVDQCKCVRIMP